MHAEPNSFSYSLENKLCQGKYLHVIADSMVCHCHEHLQCYLENLYLMYNNIFRIVSEGKINGCGKDDRRLRR